MQVYNNIDALPEFEKPVITTGTFDGVHQGHLKILQQLVQEASVIDGTPVLITFHPHPREVLLQNAEGISVLNTQEEKYRLLAAHGIRNIICVPFTKSFASLSAEQYIRDFLVARLHPHTIITGYDHKFGTNREGDFDMLKHASALYGFTVKEIPEHVLSNVIISSTKIREALLTGAIDTANEFLGYPYMLNGHVVEGKKIGRTLGFPTANIEIPEENKLIPALGIYAVRVRLQENDTSYKGMLSIGTNPTVAGKTRTIEVNIFDFDKDIYGEQIEVDMIKRLRAEEKYSSLDALKLQMIKDKEETLSILGNL